jgi:RNA ligase (TIGR02306 family)
MAEFSVEADRCLASIVQINDIVPIEGADKIVLAKVLGWQCVVKKDEFNIGDIAVYCSIDSVLPNDDKNFEFMKDRGFRVKTIKLRGQISQGLLGPLSWLTERGHDKEFNLDDDVTAEMGCTKYVSAEEYDQYAPAGSKTSVENNDKSPMPSFIPKTDEPRLQGLKGMKSILEVLPTVNHVVTRKEDGQSGTFYFYNGEYGVCGRRFRWLTETPESINYYNVNTKYGIEDKLKQLGRNIAVQGEVIGPKINCNRLQLKEVVYKVFNIWNIDTQTYLDWDEVKSICETIGLQTVPELVLPSDFDFSLKSFLDFADGQVYGKGIPAEGIVVKTNNGASRVSFKVISNKYLLKNNL